MPEGMPTFLDIARANDSRIATFIDPIIHACPELAALPMETIQGTTYETLVRRGLPHVAWRKANTGVPSSKSSYDRVVAQTFTLDASTTVDKAVADRYQDGPDAYLAMEAQGIMKAALRMVSRQFYYGPLSGVGGAADGPPGLIQFVADELKRQAKATEKPVNPMVIDAKGTASADGGLTSAWILAATAAGQRTLHFLQGQGGQFNVGPRVDTLARDKDGHEYDAYRRSMLAYLGLDAPAPDIAMVRIKNLGPAAAHGLTDELLAEAFNLFPAGVTPTHAFISRRSNLQLWKYRARQSTGNPNGMPNGFDNQLSGFPGVALTVTDGIREDEETFLAA